MRAYISTFLFLLILTLNAQSQDEAIIDSVSTFQNEQLDSLYYQLFLKYRTSDQILAEKFAIQSYETAHLNGDENYIGKSSNALGYIYNLQLEYEKSLKYYMEALMIAQVNDEENRLMYLYNNIGNVYLRSSQFDKAIENYLESLNYAIKLEKYSDQSIAHSNIGLLYYKLGNSEVAVDHLKKSLEIKTEYNITQGIVETYINLGLCYNSLGNYADAISSFNYILTLIDDEDNNNLLEVYFGMGKTHFNNKEYASAIRFFNLAKEIAENTGNVISASSIDYYLAYVFYSQGNKKIALDFLNSSHEMAKEANAWDRLKNNYELYAKIYENDRNYRKAYNSLKNFVVYQDSIFNEELAENFKDAYVNFEQSLSNDIIAGQEVALKKNKKYAFTLSMILLLAIVIAIFAYRTAYYRRKLNQELDTLVKVKTHELVLANDKLVKSQHDLNTFLYKTSHDLRGPIATLIGLTNLSKFENPNKEINTYLDKIGMTTSHLNNVIDSLTTVSHISAQDVKLERVPVIGLLNNILTAAESTYKKKIQFRLKGDIPDFIVTDNILFEYILKNLIDNAYKFYDSSKPVNFIEIMVSSSKDTMEVILKDNGLGVPQKMVNKIFDLFVVANDKERGLGLGLYQASLAADRLNGTIRLKRHKSPTIFVVSLPVLKII